MNKNENESLRSRLIVFIARRGALGVSFDVIRDEFHDFTDSELSFELDFLVANFMCGVINHTGNYRLG